MRGSTCHCFVSFGMIIFHLQLESLPQMCLWKKMKQPYFIIAIIFFRMVNWYSSFLRLKLHPFTIHSLHPSPSSLILFEAHKIQRQLYNTTCYGLANSSPMVHMLKIWSPACVRRILKKWCFMGGLLIISDTLSKGTIISQCLSL